MTQLSLLAGCGSGTPIAAPTPPPASSPPSAPAPPTPQLPTVERIEIDASFVGGISGRGTIVLSAEAPVSGMDVALSSSDAVLVVPEKVSIAAGSLSGTFAFNSARVTGVREATITATSGGQAQTATVRLRPLDPQGTLSYVSRGRDDDVGQGGALLLRTPEHVFSGELIDGNHELQIRIASGPFVRFGLNLVAPPNQSLTVRKYENTTSLPTTAQVYFFTSFGTCETNRIGEFEILEAEFGPPGPAIPQLRPISGTILRLRARFSQQCSPTKSLLTGEVSVQGLPRIDAGALGLLAWVQPPSETLSALSR